MSRQLQFLALPIIVGVCIADVLTRRAGLTALAAALLLSALPVVAIACVVCVLGKRKRREPGPPA